MNKSRCQIPVKWQEGQHQIDIVISSSIDETSIFIELIKTQRYSFSTLDAFVNFLISKQNKFIDWGRVVQNILKWEYSTYLERLLFSWSLKYPMKFKYNAFEIWEWCKITTDETNMTRWEDIYQLYLACSDGSAKGDCHSDDYDHSFLNRALSYGCASNNLSFLKWSYRKFTIRIFLFIISETEVRHFSIQFFNQLIQYANIYSFNKLLNYPITFKLTQCFLDNKMKFRLNDYSFDPCSLLDNYPDADWTPSQVEQISKEISVYVDKPYQQDIKIMLTTWWEKEKNLFFFKDFFISEHLLIWMETIINQHERIGTKRMNCLLLISDKWPKFKNLFYMPCYHRQLPYQHQFYCSTIPESLATIQQYRNICFQTIQKIAGPGMAKMITGQCVCSYEYDTSRKNGIIIRFL